VDERAPPLPVKAPPMSFSQVIMDTVIPATSLSLKVTFTGVEDPQAHITAFYTQMMLSGGSDAVYCKLFMCLSVSPTDTLLHSTSSQRCSENSILSTGLPL